MARPTPGWPRGFTDWLARVLRGLKSAADVLSLPSLPTGIHQIPQQQRVGPVDSRLEARGRSQPAGGCPKAGPASATTFGKSRATTKNRLRLRRPRPQSVLWEWPDDADVSGVEVEVETVAEAYAYLKGLPRQRVRRLQAAIEAERWKLYYGAPPGEHISRLGAIFVRRLCWRAAVLRRLQRAGRLPGPGQVKQQQSRRRALSLSNNMGSRKVRSQPLRPAHCAVPT